MAKNVEVNPYLDQTMPNFEIIRDIFIYYHVLKVQVN